MLRFTAALAACLFVAPVASAQSFDELGRNTREVVAVSEPVVALTNVRVLDGTGAPMKEAQTVVIENGRITAVGPVTGTNMPDGAHVMDLSGHTVIPGIVGMHNHTFYTTSGRSIQANYTAPRLYLASGVTTIRTTGSMSPYSELNLKRQIEDGQVPGPRMHVTGPYISGDRAGGGMYAVSSPEAARRVVRYWAGEGATWFKFYTLISREEMKAAIDEAHSLGVKLTGHLCSVGYREAVALGIDALEHGLFANSEYDPNKEPDLCPPTAAASLANVDVASDEVQQTIRAMVDNDVAMTSTLAVYELFVPNRPQELDERMLEAMSAETRDEYVTTRRRIAENPRAGIAPEVFAKAMAFERAFVEAGGLLAAGVDPTGNGGALPGFGDQRNLELLVEAGFGVPEAVRIMTLNGARALGVDDELGSIEVGKVADLVVVNGDPVADPLDLRRTTIVFKDGVGYDSGRLIDSVKGSVGVR